MKPTLDQLKAALEQCQHGYEEIYQVIRYALQREITKREIAGRKLEYTGDAKERNLQAAKKYRDKKRFERELERDRMLKKQDRGLRMKISMPKSRKRRPRKKRQ